MRLFPLTLTLGFGFVLGCLRTREEVYTVARPLGDFRGWVRLLGSTWEEAVRGKRQDCERYLASIDNHDDKGRPVSKTVLPASERPIIRRRAA